MNGKQQVGEIRRVYKYQVWREALILVIVVAFAVGGLAINSQHASSFSPSMLTLFAMPLAFGIYLVVMAFRSFVAIDGDRIEVRGDFGERSATLSEIEGFRTVHTRNGYHRELILKDGRGKITISNGYDTDGDYRDWFQQIPDLDKRDREALLADIQEQTDLGSTPQERLGALNSAWQIAAALLALEVFAAVGLNYAPQRWQEWSAAVLIIVPFVAAYLCWRSPLLYAVFRTRSDPRADFRYALMIAGFGLWLRTSQLHFVSFDPLIIGMVLIGVAAGVVYYQPTRSGSIQRAFLGVLCLSAIYAYGSVAVADIVFDQSTATQYSTSVLTSQVLHGRYGSTSYNVSLAPWGPFDAEEDIGLSSEEYAPNPTGYDKICLNLYSGWLRAPWFRVVDCDVAPG